MTTTPPEPNWKFRAKLALSILGHGAANPERAVEEARLALQGAEIDEIIRIRNAGAV